MPKLFAHVTQDCHRREQGLSKGLADCRLYATMCAPGGSTSPIWSHKKRSGNYRNNKVHSQPAQVLEIWAFGGGIFFRAVQYCATKNIFGIGSIFGDVEKWGI